MSSRVLIVEDEASIAEVIQYNLEQQGFGVEVLDRGDQALETIRAEPPDLVILDLMLPGLDGLDLLREVRCQEETASLPVLVLTARDITDSVLLGQIRRDLVANVSHAIASRPCWPTC